MLRDLPLGADGASLVGLSYPVLDLVLHLHVAATPLVSARRGTLAGWLVAAAVAAGGIADGIYTKLVLRTDTVRRVDRPRLAGSGVLDLPRGGGRCPRDRPEVQLGAAAVAAAHADRGEHDRPLLVIVLVLVVEGVRGKLSPEAIVFVCVVAALLRLRVWMLLLSAARESARRDPLTGVYDEPHLHDQLRRLAAAARQYDEPFALALLQRASASCR